MRAIEEAGRRVERRTGVCESMNEESKVAAALQARCSR